MIPGRLLRIPFEEGQSLCEAQHCVELAAAFGSGGQSPTTGTRHHCRRTPGVQSALPARWSAYAVSPERTRSPALVLRHLRSHLRACRPTGGQAYSPRIPDGSCLPLLPPERCDRLLQGPSARNTGGFRQQDSVRQLRVRPVQPIFRTTIENDLGAYTKPARVFARIPGKRSVPSLKQHGPVEHPLAHRCRKRRLPLHRVRGRPACQDRPRRDPDRTRGDARRLHPNRSHEGIRADRADAGPGSRAAELPGSTGLDQGNRP